MISYLYIALLLIVAGMSNGIMDTLQFKYASSRLGALNPAFWNPAVSWKNKYKNWDGNDKRPRFLLSMTALVFLTDAWHLFQFVMLSSFTAAIVLALYLDIDYSLLHAAAGFAIAKMLFSAGFHITYTIILPMNSKLFSVMLVLFILCGGSAIAQKIELQTPTDSTYLIVESEEDDYQDELNINQTLSKLYDRAVNADIRAATWEVKADEQRRISNQAARLIREIAPDTSYQAMLNERIGDRYEGNWLIRYNDKDERVEVSNRRFTYNENRIVIIPNSVIEFRMRGLINDEDVTLQLIRDKVFRGTDSKGNPIIFRQRN